MSFFRDVLGICGNEGRIVDIEEKRIIVDQRGYYIDPFMEIVRSMANLETEA